MPLESTGERTKTFIQVDASGKNLDIRHPVTHRAELVIPVQCDPSSPSGLRTITLSLWATPEDAQRIFDRIRKSQVSITFSEGNNNLQNHK